MNVSIHVNERIKSHIPPLRPDELVQLESNILRDGCHTPLIIWSNDSGQGGTLLDGHNRYAICQKHHIGFTVSHLLLDSIDDALEWVEENQLGRRNLTPDQFAYFLGRKYDRAKSQGARRDLTTSAQNGQKSGEWAADVIAEQHGVSRNTVRRAADYAQNVEAIADLVGDEAREEILSGRIGDHLITRSDVSTIAKALPEAKSEGIIFSNVEEAKAWAKAHVKEEKKVEQEKKAQNRTQRESELAETIKSLPEKKYGVILADPEWRFEVYSRETGMDRAADNHYPTSQLEEIKTRDIPSISADDCALFLWATVPMLPQALEVMATWGFTYKSQIVWVKDRIGTGYWFRNKHEILLLGTRGSPPAPTPGTQSVSLIEAPVSEHSAKPEAFLELIEQYFPTLPKIELNRRGPARKNWDAWGYEVDEFYDEMSDTTHEENLHD